MRNITLDGRLGKDAEVLTAKNGRQYVRFNIANNLYTSGNERTDWFDVTCYDPFVVEKKSQYLKKGSYVIITGQIISEVRVVNGNIYMNHYVTAATIDTPRFGKRDDDSEHSQSRSRTNEPSVSVYTGGTRSDRSMQESRVEEPRMTAMPTPAPATAPSYTPSEYSTDVDYSNGGDDDLPF